MAVKWLVIADRTKARIYKQKPFTMIDTLENSLGREKNRAMTTGKPGLSRSKFSQPSSTHSLTGEKSPHEDAAMQFARSLCRFLERRNAEHKFSELLIAAEPKMARSIRSSMEKHLTEKVHWMKKDFAHLSDFQIGEVFELNEPRKKR